MYFLYVIRSPVKLTTLVDFPQYGFDMSPHLSPGAGQTDAPGLLWSPWRRPRSPPRPPPHADEYTYDLYAVCNHHGQDLQGGHYTGKSSHLLDINIFLNIRKRL